MTSVNDFPFNCPLAITLTSPSTVDNSQLSRYFDVIGLLIVLVFLHPRFVPSLI
jgi:hypothetical protein